MPAAEAEGALKAKCQMDNDKETSGKNEKKEKSVSIWIEPFFRPGASAVNFMGNCAGSGGHHDPPSPGPFIEPAEGKIPQHRTSPLWDAEHC